ncbi:bifunctional 2-polyprenyl-6-hydroxyphenol methylase/3-demethylubiquinol 3-O-methyltransferase UbiG [Novosphingobium profundi]|uniref:bifunctional 2-polyprenyl-6-hydroxyphenol methylase/3-demethylubiquinol 3-O-methyltransferase UbiG n=1 Tax=Novosphingobium profundi TaxID=1774954 RepID=UPI001BDACED2|nr:bifunctional 2-polyprenyl-6-hydroxyphenol methylase/3-demethylubiquinol 3-O-methyltransferase UbiG [Novosphingobium profundi]MBT0670315.1 bifunctional 2-polyprenyl-6-hydroxyphenol methylase/3-demethylubiquinol 3-O-methyltransferase UbiG [Novosphingobium profundi]
MNNATPTATPDAIPAAAQSAAPAAAPATIRPEEAAHFGTLAAEWWDPKGSSAMLHKLNPVRLGFIRQAIDAHFHTETRTLKPLAGRRALDAGCGAGLLCEPLARLGAEVTGVDAAPENIAAARAHAEASGLAIDYRCGELGSLGLAGFDLVCSLEVIEHVADKGAFLQSLAGCLAPDGLMILSCPNRTTRSRLLLVEAAERLGKVPRGTHDWASFPTPEELAELAAGAGLELGEPTGISWSPTKGLHLSEDLALNFIVTARHART